MRFTKTATALALSMVLVVPALAQTSIPNATTGQGTSGLQQNAPAGATPQADLGTGAGVPRAAKKTKQQRQAARTERRDRRPTDPRDRAFMDGGMVGGGGAASPATTTGGTAGTTGQGTSSLRN